MALGLGNTYDVSVKFLADLKGYTRNIEMASKKMEQFGKRTAKVGASLTKSITLPLIAMGAAAINASLKMNTAMANVATLIPGATERVIELKKEVQDLAMETGKATGEMVTGLYEVISAFGDTGETMARLEANARLAVAGFSSVKEAVNFTSAATKGFGDISAKAIKTASDLGLLTVRLGKTSFPELSGSIGKLTGSAKALNISLEELMAMYATLTGVTGDTAKVTTQIDAAMRAFMRPTKGMTEAIGKLENGIYDGAEALIGAKGLVGALRAVLETTDGAVESVGKLVESTEAFPLIFALAGAQAEVFDGKLRQMNDSLGTTAEAVKAATEGINEAGFRWDKFKVKFVVMAERLGDVLIPVFERFVGWIEKIITKIEDWTTWFSNLDKGTQNLIINIGLLVIAIGPLLLIIGKLIGAFAAMRAVLIGSAVGGAAGGIVGALGLLIGILGGPVGVIAVIGTAAVVIGVKYYNAVQYAKDITASFADTTENMAIRVATAWSEAFASVSDSIYKMNIAIRSSLETAERTAALLQGGRVGFLTPPSKWEVARPPTEEEVQKGVEGIYNLINILAASGELGLEKAEVYRRSIKAGGEDIAIEILDSLRREFHDVTFEDLFEAPPKITIGGGGGVGGGGGGGVGAGGVKAPKTWQEQLADLEKRITEDALALSLKRRVGLIDELELQRGLNDLYISAAESATELYAKLDDGSEVMTDAFLPIIDGWIRVNKEGERHLELMEMLTKKPSFWTIMAASIQDFLRQPGMQELLRGLTITKLQRYMGPAPEAPDIMGFLGLPTPKDAIDWKRRTAEFGEPEEEVTSIFDNIYNALIDGAMTLGESIASGDIQKALENIFQMLGDAIAESISKYIMGQIPGLGGGLLGGLFGGLVGGLFSSIFGGRDDRGATEQTPIFAFITNWEDYYKFGVTLPESFVYSGRAGRYDVDPHGRTLSGWATGQHFDA